MHRSIDRLHVVLTHLHVVTTTIQYCTHYFFKDNFFADKHRHTNKLRCRFPPKKSQHDSRFKNLVKHHIFRKVIRVYRCRRTVLKFHSVLFQFVTQKKKALRLFTAPSARQYNLLARSVLPPTTVKLEGPGPRFFTLGHRAWAMMAA